MHRHRAWPFGCLLLIVSGCDQLSQRYMLSAAPLVRVADLDKQALPSGTDTKATVDAPAGDTLTNIDRVHLLVQDSETKCSHFVNSMFVQSAGTNFILDVLNTASSALATVFTPIAATHAFSAASTIFGGAKTSITADYLNNLTLSHIAQAIQSTYTTDMNNYVSRLNSKDPTTINPYVERSAILSYHNECALAPAEGTISATLQSTDQPQSAAKDTVSYTVKNSDVASIAASLAQAINDLKLSDRSIASNAGPTVRLSSGTSITELTQPNGGTRVDYQPGPPPTLTIGTPHAGDQITFRVAFATGSASASAAAPLAVSPRRLR